MKGIYFICIGLFVSLTVSSQNREWQPKTREVIVNQGDSVMRFDILIKPESVKIDNNLIYYWHNKGQICFNQGDYAGELLNGEYLVFTRDKKLITKGEIEKGLRIGIWKNWYKDGTLKSVQNYSKGSLDGESTFYNEQGELITSFQYRQGEKVVEEKKGFNLFKSQNTADSTAIENVEEVKIETENEDKVTDSSEQNNSQVENVSEGRPRKPRTRNQ